MEAVAIGSLISSGTAAVAGAGTTAFTVGSVVGAAGPVLPTAISFGQIAAGFGALSAATAMFTGMSAADRAYSQTLEASRANLEASRARFAESELGTQRERTQAALEDAERQRRLRRTLASQRAAFAGGGIDPFSGTPVTIAEQTAGEINRESRLAQLATEDAVSAINRQGYGSVSIRNR